jgi:D-alanine transaminase/branched-chain amino acid aminotransferase
LSLTWINGTETPSNAAFIRPDDLGFQRGYAAFEFMRFEHGRIFHALDHLQRLERSATLLGIQMPISQAELAEVCTSLARRSGLPSPGIRILLTGGYAGIPIEDRKPNLVLIAEPMPVISADNYRCGIVLMTVQFQREIPAAKTNNYMNEFRLESVKRQNRADDLLYHANGLVTESPRSNFFAVIDGRIVTPDQQILFGITRKIMFESARSIGISVEERQLKCSELNEASEAFITSTTKRILPVTRIDGRAVGNGTVGGITTNMMRRYEDYVVSSNWE